SDRALALKCIQALITDANERHFFVERQTRRRFSERASEERFEVDLRLRLREFISGREVSDEAQIRTLNCAVWPGRSIAKHLFRIASQNPHDPLLRGVMQRSTAILPDIWNSDCQMRRSQHGANEDEERYDPQIEHNFVDAICRYAIQLRPAEALELL